MNEALSKLCMNIDVGYAVILAFHIFHLKGQLKKAYIKMINVTVFLSTTKTYFSINLKQLRSNWTGSGKLDSDHRKTSLKCVKR